MLWVLHQVFTSSAIPVTRQGLKAPCQGLGPQWAALGKDKCSDPQTTTTTCWLAGCCMIFKFMRCWDVIGCVPLCHMQQPWRVSGSFMVPQSGRELVSSANGFLGWSLSLSLPCAPHQEGLNVLRTWDKCSPVLEAQWPWPHGLNTLRTKCQVRGCLAWRRKGINKVRRKAGKVQ